jgi:hypothetical protein
MPIPPKVTWSSYADGGGTWEGPIAFGSATYAPPAAPSWRDKLLATVAATEGRPDAVRLVDRAVCSAGMCQWTEVGAGMAVSKLLGAIAAVDRQLVEPLAPALARTGAVFAQKPDGAWRFQHEGAWVETGDQCRALYWGGVSGRRGSWTDDARTTATTWASCLSATLAQPAAILAQVAYSLPKLEGYAWPSARAILWDGTAPDNAGLPGALRAAYLSYALNNPTIAARQLSAVVTSAPKWSMPWAVAVLRSLAFGPGIAIYPGRYDRIRPVLERYWGVSLPPKSGDLDAAAASV